jgi:hypothetical protein
VFTKDGICTLADIAIIDPMHADLFPQSCTTERFITFEVAQAKEKKYCD